MYCLIVAVLGSSFNYGLNIGLYNTPWKVIRNFCDQVHQERYGVPMKNATFTKFNSILNGLMPAGGIFGSIFAGFLADNLGR